MLELSSKPTLIAGPCTAESKELLYAAAEHLAPLARRLNYRFILKASFDKANRSSISSSRGPGLDSLLQWFTEVKSKFPDITVTTDVHESHQVELIKHTVDVIQIPAFLCRQTDLLLAAARSGCEVTVKKGQFLPPAATAHIRSKMLTSMPNEKLSLIERGTCFGYGDLVVDMRGLKIMHDLGSRVIFDITHSTQQPTGTQATTSGAREFAGLLARSAVATGYVSGIFLETHPTPQKAWSDSEVQLNFEQSARLLESIEPLWSHRLQFTQSDSCFTT